MRTCLRSARDCLYSFEGGPPDSALRKVSLQNFLFFGSVSLHVCLVSCGAYSDYSRNVLEFIP